MSSEREPRLPLSPVGALSRHYHWSMTSDWSIPALRDHMDQRFDDDRRHLDEVIERIDERHKTFEVQVAEAKQASNEWRGALSDRERNTISRIEFDTRVAAITAREDAIEAKGEAATKILEALLSALGTKVDSGFESLRISRAEEIRDRVTGRRTINDVRVWVFGAAGFIGAVIGVVGWSRG